MDIQGTAARRALRRTADSVGNGLVEGFHLVGLFAIGAATVWAAVIAFIAMAHKGSASIEDLLLLFIYLEIGAMVGIYFKTNHMPVRFLIYVAITALTRHLVGFANPPHKVEMDILLTAGAILILAISVLVLRYASYRFPSERSGTPEAKSGGEA
ncbi:MAG: phosphate-starvation-inducible protein PsiE [Hyphomicrobiaceae bacterium]